MSFLLLCLRLGLTFGVGEEGGAGQDGERAAREGDLDYADSENLTAFVYPSNEGPLYHKGHTIILGLLVYAWFA